MYPRHAVVDFWPGPIRSLGASCAASKAREELSCFKYCNESLEGASLCHRCWHSVAEALYGCLQRQLRRIRPGPSRMPRCMQQVQSRFCKQVSSMKRMAPLGPLERPGTHSRDCLFVWDFRIRTSFRHSFRRYKSTLVSGFDFRIGLSFPKVEKKYFRFQNNELRGIRNSGRIRKSNPSKNPHPTFVWTFVPDFRTTNSTYYSEKCTTLVYFTASTPLF
jgi:hypothetical protein